jgi:hypothetical protein
MTVGLSGKTSIMVNYVIVKEHGGNNFLEKFGTPYK